MWTAIQKIATNLLFIASMTVCFVVFMTGVMDGHLEIMRFVLLAIAFPIFIGISIYFIRKKNRKIATLINELKNHQSHIVTYNYKVSEWLPFARPYFNQKIRASWRNYLMYTLPAVLFFGFILTKDVKLFLVLGSPAIVLMILLLISLLSQRKQIKKHVLNHEKNHVIIGIEGMLINGKYLIAFHGEDRYLYRCDRTEHAGYECLQFEVKQKSGKSYTIKEHLIPVFEKDQHEINAVLKRCNAMMRI